MAAGRVADCEAACCMATSKRAKFTSGGVVDWHRQVGQCTSSPRLCRQPLQKECPQFRMYGRKSAGSAYAKRQSGH